MFRPMIAVLAVAGLSGLPVTAADKPAESVPKVVLGIAVEELPNEGPHGGLVVRHLTPDGPAAKAGVKAGDVIVRVSNLQVDDFEELLGAVAGHKPGDQITLAVLRDREPVRLKVTLGAADAKAGAAPDGCRSCAYLGVLTMPTTSITEATADRLGLTDEKGLVVIDVVPGSPAAHAGLRHGDVIRMIDKEEVRDPDALRAHVKQAGTGKDVALTVQRGDRTREVKATLAEGPCDVMLFTPKRTGRGAGTDVEQLRKQVEELEKRIKELEGKRPPTVGK